MKIKKLLRDFSFTISSNLISLIVSTVVILILPKVLGVAEYGYWQLYIFFTAYVGIFHFGWADGIYLRYSGIFYSDLDKHKFHSQIYWFTLLQLVISILLFILSYTSSNIDRIFIYQATSIAIMLINVRQLLLYILQGTSRIKEYSIITILDRAIYVGLIIILLVFKVADYRLMILCDLFGKLISMLVAFYECKGLLFTSKNSFSNSMQEAKANISVGIKLLLANFGSFLILGVVRYSVELFWGVRTFGKVSLTLSVSNMMITFVNAISIVIFPMLRRVKLSELPNIYILIRELVMCILFATLLLYYPVNWLLPKWLPAYAQTLSYLSVLFPMCVYEGKFELLISTFFKTLRLEKSLLLTNVFTLFLSFILTGINVIWFKNLNVIMLSIIFILGCRSTFSEIFLASKLKIRIGIKVLQETILIIVFVVSGWYLKFPSSILIYVIFFMMYIAFNFKMLKRITLKVLGKDF